MFKEEFINEDKSSFDKNINSINKSIEAAIKRKDQKTLDALTKDLEKILRDLKDQNV